MSGRLPFVAAKGMPPVRMCFRRGSQLRNPGGHCREVDLAGGGSCRHSASVMDAHNCRHKRFDQSRVLRFYRNTWLPASRRDDEQAQIAILTTVTRLRRAEQRPKRRLRWWPLSDERYPPLFTLLPRTLQLRFRLRVIPTEQLGSMLKIDNSSRRSLPPST